MYLKYLFVRTSINNWKIKIKKDKEGKTIFKKQDQRNILSEDLMRKAKIIMFETRATGTAVSRHIVMAIGNGMVRSNSPTILKENGGPLELTKVLARGVLKYSGTSLKRASSKVDTSLRWTKNFASDEFLRNPL